MKIMMTTKPTKTPLFLAIVIASSIAAVAPAFATDPSKPGTAAIAGPIAATPPTGQAKPPSVPSLDLQSAYSQAKAKLDLSIAPYLPNRAMPLLGRTSPNISAPAALPAPAPLPAPAIVRASTPVPTIAPVANPHAGPTRAPTTSQEAKTLATVQVVGNRDHLLLERDQITITALQTDLSTAKVTIEKVTTERDDARAQLADSEHHVQTAEASAHNQKGLTDMALHKESDAAQSFAAAAAHGDMNAQSNLALLYLEGRGVDLDQQRGLTMLQQAAAGGNESAARNLALIYKSGIAGVPADPSLAEHWESVVLQLTGHAGMVLSGNATAAEEN
jgi:hypothetical protein